MVKGLRVLKHKRTEAGCFNEFLIAKTPADVENCDPVTTTLPAVSLTHTVVYSTVSGQPATASDIGGSRQQASIRLPQPAPMSAATSGVGTRIVQSAPGSSRTGQAACSDNARRAKRRERNRVAAAKCRKKRQDQLDGLADACRQLEASNSELEQQVEELANRRRQLASLLRDHEAECSAGIAPAPEMDAVADSLTPAMAEEEEEEEEEGMELLEAEQCFSPPMVTCAGSPPPVWRPAPVVATRPGDLLLPPEPTESSADGLSTLTTPLSSLLTPHLSAVKSEPASSL